MSTHADFYVGRGLKAEWIGSVTGDGHPENFPAVAAAQTEEAYRAAVEAALQAWGDRVLRPPDGWSRIWDDSHDSDFAFAFDAGAFWICPYDEGWHTPEQYEAYLRDEALDIMPPVFPSMRAPRYPEHVKLRAVSDRTQVIGTFLEWCEGQGLTLAKWDASGDLGRHYEPLQKLLARWAEIDLDKLEAEKQQMLEEQRALSASRQHAGTTRAIKEAQ